MKPEDLPFKMIITSFFNAKGRIVKLGHSLKGPTTSANDGMYTTVDGVHQLTDEGIALSMEIAASLVAGICRQAAHQKWGGESDPRAIQFTIGMMIEEKMRNTCECVVEKVNPNNQN